MARISAPCGYELDALPTPPPVFRAIQETGKLSDPEMYPAYNMGVGFTITMRPGSEARVIELAAAHGIEAWVLGRATDSSERVVTLPGIKMVIDADGFRAVS